MPNLDQRYLRRHTFPYVAAEATVDLTRQSAPNQDKRYLRDRTFPHVAALASVDVAGQTAPFLASPSRPSLPDGTGNDAAEPVQAMPAIPKRVHSTISNSPQPQPADIFESGRPSHNPTCIPARASRLIRSDAVN